jgi:hypothetical protein
MGIGALVSLALVQQRFAMEAVSCDQLLDNGLFDRLLPVFYTQYPVAVLKIEVDPAMGEILFQEKENCLGSLFVRDVGPEYLDNF